MQQNAVVSTYNTWNKAEISPVCGVMNKVNFEIIKFEVS